MKEQKKHSRKSAKKSRSLNHICTLKKKDAFRERKHSELEIERFKANLIENGFGEEKADEISDSHDLYMTSDLYDNYFKDIDEAQEELKTLRLDREIYKKFLDYIRKDN